MFAILLPFALTLPDSDHTKMMQSARQLVEWINQLLVLNRLRT
jgi:hypothetical protein